MKKIINLVINTTYVSVPLCDEEGHLIGETECIRYSLTIDNETHWWVVSDLDWFDINIMGIKNVKQRYKDMLCELIDGFFRDYKGN